MEAGRPGKPGEPGHGDVGGTGGAGGRGGRGGNPNGVGGAGGTGGVGGGVETYAQSSLRLGLGSRTRTRWTVLVWAVLVMVGLLGGAYILAAKVVENADATTQIQAERARNVRDGCEATNERHDDTVTALDRLVDRARRGASPQQRRQMQQSRAATVLLIDALAPKRDCDALVRLQVGSAKQ